MYTNYADNVLTLSWSSSEICVDSDKSSKSSGSVLGSIAYWLFVLFGIFMLGMTVFNYALQRVPLPDAIPLMPVWLGIIHAVIDGYSWLYEKIVGSQYVRL